MGGQKRVLRILSEKSDLREPGGRMWYQKKAKGRKEEASGKKEGVKEQKEGQWGEGEGVEERKKGGAETRSHGVLGAWKLRCFHGGKIREIL